MARIRDLFRYPRVASGSALTIPSAYVDTTRAIRSPWSVGTLTRVAVEDIFAVTDPEGAPLSRAQAMSVPAVSRARHLIAGQLARCQLVLYRGGERVPADQQPQWLNPQRVGVSGYHRMLWTADDLLFGGWSLWAAERDSDGFVTDALRVPAEQWRFDDNGAVHYVDVDGGDDHPVDRASALLIPGPHEGILDFGARTIRGAARIEEAVADRAENPVPLTELRETIPEAQLDEDEVETMLDRYRRKRGEPGGSVGFTPYGVELHTHGDTGGDFLVHARNAAAIDAARHAGMPAAMIDASNVNSTLTYETLQGRALQFVEQTLALYGDPVAATLSLDDVVPSGEHVAIDYGPVITNPPSPTGPERTD